MIFALQIIDERNCASELFQENISYLSKYLLDRNLGIGILKRFQ